MTRLPLPVRRAAALGLLVIALASLWSLIVQPITLAFEDYNRQIADDRALLQRYLSRAADSAQIAARRDALRQALSATARFLEGDNAALIEADLQERVKALTAASGGTLNSTQALPSADEGGFRKIAIRVSMEADTPALQSIVRALEAETPLLFLDNLEIRAIAGRARRGGTSERDRLKVRSDLFGFMRGEAS